jgi:hypothetical protein
MPGNFDSVQLEMSGCELWKPHCAPVALYLKTLMTGYHEAGNSPIPLSSDSNVSDE